MKALTAKNPALYLLNKVLDLVFSEEELRDTKGARGLDKHKMDALKGTSKLNTVHYLNSHSFNRYEYFFNHIMYLLIIKSFIFN